MTALLSMPHTGAMDLTAATPVEIDTALSEIYVRLYAQQDRTAQLHKWIKDYEDGLRKKADQPLMYSSYSPEKLRDLERQYEESIDLANTILQETFPYESEYRTRPWSRFFLVNNSGGHIHSSMGCSTCYWNTRFSWLPALSGLTEAEAVAAHGAILCTVCYPSAPVEYTDRRDPSVCTGSGDFYDSEQPKRTGFYSGNWGTCKGCGTRQTVSKIGKIRKHKKA